jgi:hypothetical protein
VITVVVILFLMPARGADFWLTIVALFGLIGMQAVYWMIAHPVNKVWLHGALVALVVATT